MERFLQDVVSWQGGGQEELAAKATLVFKRNLAETPEAIGMLEVSAVCYALACLRSLVCLARKMICFGPEMPLAWSSAS